MSLFASRGVQRRPDPPEWVTDDVPVVAAGTGLWALALVVLVVLRATGHEVHDWWLEMCVAGIALGVIGIRVCLGRRRRRDTSSRPADPPG